MDFFDHTVIVVEKMPPKVNVTPEQRQQIISQLLLHLKDGVAITSLRCHMLTEVANIFGVVPGPCLIFGEWLAKTMLI